MGDNQLSNWNTCRRILCIRPDNMGDVLMSSPAIRALKEHFGVQLAILTSQKGAAAARLNPFVDEVITFDLPWQKFYDLDPGAAAVLDLVARLREQRFDGCVVFTVYSQNPMPCIMLAYLAGIPLRLAYCRENPYGLLTNWVPDEEPYEKILHQVSRDLALVAEIGAIPSADDLIAEIPAAARQRTVKELARAGIAPDQHFFVVSTGASERRRNLPLAYWFELLKSLRAHSSYGIVLTGTKSQQSELSAMKAAVPDVVIFAGNLNVAELAYLVRKSAGVLSVNTGTVHLAAATKTPVCVLYARTNPQHTPWKVKNQVFYYSPTGIMPSSNAVIGYVNRKLYKKQLAPPAPGDVVSALLALSRSGLP
ncbi:glycosyltransferase family 9 protein [Pedobacter sp. SYP-B3415]|uniref:glycosyltransferase family 9 protein n=1 Tax=Pedobacter sp. SYP-B3415 TaxID=2496641 RepID=UPI00101D7608|nr:glycosyltransferase family 9 protein [Pedobacter sp. SYP-B3415]